MDIFPGWIFCLHFNWECQTTHQRGLQGILRSVSSRSGCRMQTGPASVPAAAPASLGPELGQELPLWGRKAAGGWWVCSDPKKQVTAPVQRVHNVSQTIYKMPPAVWENTMASHRYQRKGQPHPARVCTHTHACMRAHTAPDSPRSKDAVKPVHDIPAHNTSMSPKG